MPQHTGPFVFRFKKDFDRTENYDLVATYLAALLSPDPILGWPQSNQIYKNTREITSTTGWACEHKTDGGSIQYQLGRSNDYFMSPVDGSGAWRVSHRYFNDELLAAARTFFLYRFSEMLEVAGDQDVAA